MSFHRPYARPKKRGKQGHSVEFGGKGALVHVGGFLFLDYFEHGAFPENKLTGKHVQCYKERFGKLPPSFTADKIYGSRENRDLLEGYKIRPSFKPLGRRRKTPTKEDRWFKNKQKERNRIEGSFGKGNEHYGLNRGTCGLWIDKI